MNFKGGRVDVTGGTSGEGGVRMVPLEAVNRIQMDGCSVKPEEVQEETGNDVAGTGKEGDNAVNFIALLQSCRKVFVAI